ncbi:DUF5134 domain-containing protein [Streptomyces sp. MnatMP-M17]|uniref:DUF5134 domain-containing protein n=1 Tax=unclassified Streptomyces TaxID=2593676 RepID=UPI00081E47F3|nr:DUF5134 domain-containing protein [Streptomyces sp. MnatMP-M17]MYZ37657.1 DUF5134 domain-containing protein [Streptomyces sp. SID4917]SCF93006.1 protein of unknown function [Streptomyces sp. MnatMP-M17]
MHGPAAAGWLLVALCVATGGYCLLRMRSGVAEQRRWAGSEALMGFGTAVMAVPAAVLPPPRWVWTVYAAVFGGAALYTVVRSRIPAYRAHGTHHLLGMLAMVYMAGAMAAAPGGAHGAHTAAGAPLVTGALLIYYAGYVLRTGGRLLPLPAGAAPEAGGTAMVIGTGTATAGLRWGDRTELALACRLSMGIAMLAMLLTV